MLGSEVSVASLEVEAGLQPHEDLQQMNTEICKEHRHMRSKCQATGSKPLLGTVCKATEACKMTANQSQERPWLRPFGCVRLSARDRPAAPH